MKIYSFSEKDYERVKRTVRRFEAYYLNGPPQRPRYPVGGGSGLVPAKCPGSTVAAGSVASPTSFTATFYSPASGTGPGFAASADTVTAYNPYTSSLAANSLIWLAFFGGKWYVVAANC